jgi:hypothetical protein
VTCLGRVVVVCTTRLRRLHGGSSPQSTVAMYAKSVLTPLLEKSWDPTTTPGMLCVASNRPPAY